MTDDGPLRVAIAGLGPKGLFALERLVHHATVRGAPLRIDAYEPHPEPGAGPVYDPRQPAYLRMNLAADRLDLWCGENAGVPASERLSFARWRVAGAPEAAGESYPPRAVVGRYLADGLRRLRARLPDRVRLRVLPVAVAAIAPRAGRWAVTGADGSEAGYDEVLVATGHGAGATDAGDRPAWPHAAPLVPAVFPVGRWLGPDRVPPGAVAGVRGFALTFLDAALALTEGRGGGFVLGPDPLRPRYEPGSSDVACLVPFSRTGRPVLAKPHPEVAAAVPGLDEIGAEGRAALRSARLGGDPRADLVPLVARTAAAALTAAGRSSPGAAALGFLTRACGAAPRMDVDPCAAIARSLEVGAGRRPPDLAWGLGHAWQTLYPALVERLGGDGMPERAWPPFLRLAAEMERIAFGPPPENAVKLLALVRAGRVDASRVAGARPVTTGGVTVLGPPAHRRPVDVVIDAVLPSPGAGAAPLLAPLVAAGAARVAPRRRGIEVTANATCVGRHGSPTPGLAVLGRATEDSVVGNDTLNRRLHPQAHRWAERVAARAAAGGRVGRSAA